MVNIKTCFPLGALLTNIVLLVQTVTFAVRLIAHGSSAQGAIGVVGLILWVGPWVGLGAYMSKNFAATWVEVPRCEISTLRYVARGCGKWVDTGTGFVRRMGPTFRYFRKPFQWAILAEVAVACLCGMIVGSRPFVSGCGPYAAAMAVVLGLHAVAICATRPFCSVWDNASFGALSVLLFVAAVVVAAGETSSVAVAVLPLAVMFVCFVKVVVDILLRCILRKSPRRSAEVASANVSGVLAVVPVDDVELQVTPAPRLQPVSSKRVHSMPDPFVEESPRLQDVWGVSGFVQASRREQDTILHSPVGFGSPTSKPTGLGDSRHWSAVHHEVEGQPEPPLREYGFETFEAAFAPPPANAFSRRSADDALDDLL
jgi:hypothetical protein